MSFEDHYLIPPCPYIMANNLPAQGPVFIPKLSPLIFNHSSLYFQSNQDSIVKSLERELGFEFPIIPHLTSSHNATGPDTPLANNTTPAELDQASLIRACFEKMIGEGQFSTSPSPSYQGSRVHEFSLDRDPSELCRDFGGISVCPSELIKDEKVFALDLEQGYGFCEDNFEISSFQELELAPLKPSKEVPLMNLKPRKGKKSEKATLNNRQSKFKNTYSLTEEHTRRLIKDWFSLKPCERKMVQQEEKKSEEIKLKEANEIEIDFANFEGIDQECNELKKKMKMLRSNKESGVIMKDLIAERESKLAEKKILQNNLLQKLRYKRFGLVSSLSALINQTSSAFLKKNDFVEYLKKNPKNRTLTSMRSFFQENLKFGLIILRTALEILFPMKGSSGPLASKGSYALKFWLIKSPMEAKSKNLFKNESSRAHIEKVLREMYEEMRDLAKKEILDSELRRFDAHFSAYTAPKEEFVLFNQCKKRLFCGEDCGQSASKRKKWNN